VAIICLVAYLDGGLTSPAALMLFLTLVFAATSYPLGSMVIVVIASVTGVAAIGILGGATEQAFEADPAYVWVFLVSMALSGVLCMWQSRLGERHRAELAELSRTDPLTGCLNRRGFSERLDAELSRAERDGSEVALIQLDLNGFKSVNDRHGHATGDELLRWVGSTLQALLRGSDATGRLGGDEFALLLPGLGAAEANAVAERTVAALAERIGATAGVACHPADGATGDALHRHADADLYSRKLSTRAG
jgi:diguanylate cyclase (GGDEF)-like protein